MTGVQADRLIDAINSLETTLLWMFGSWSRFAPCANRAVGDKVGLLSGGPDMEVVEVDTVNRIACCHRKGDDAWTLRRIPFDCLESRVSSRF